MPQSAAAAAPPPAARRASKRKAPTGDAAQPRVTRQPDDLSGEEEEEEEGEEGEYGRAWSELASPHPASRLGDVRDDDDGGDDDIYDDDAASDGDDGDEPAAYDVQRVVGARRLEDGSWEYRVRWHGYGADQNSWEPVAHLASVTHATVNKQMEEAKQRAEASAEQCWLNTRGNTGDPEVQRAAAAAGQREAVAPSASGPSRRPSLRSPTAAARGSEAPWSSPSSCTRVAAPRRA